MESSQLWQKLRQYWNDCGVVSWNGTMYINCIRSIQEPELELHFYRVLQRLGLPVKVESNRRGRG